MTDRIECPTCHFMNDSQAMYCDVCGEPLMRGTLRDPQAPPEAAQPRTGSPDVQALPPVKTRQVEPEKEYTEPRWGDARIDDSTAIRLQVLHHDRGLAVVLPEDAGITLGRLQAGAGQEARLDLSAFDAVDAGVSREHARLERHEYSLYVIDLESTNGTFLNGLRILPRHPRVVRDGDEIRLGRLKLQVLFVRSEPPQPAG